MAYFILFSLILSSFVYSGEIWLTWQHDPTTTMVVSWLSSKEKSSSSVFIVYRKYKGEDSTWITYTGSNTSFPGDDKKLINFAELMGLEPNTEYEFRVGKNKEIFRFKTAPQDLQKSLSFIVGGDSLEDDTNLFKAMNKRAVKYEPYFIVIGGDVAYAVDKEKEDPNRWQKWLQIWFETMRIDSKRLIPVLAVPGNHDVRGGFDRSPKSAETFYALFRSPDPECYTVLRFGTYLSLYLLDSGHACSVYGEQREWIANELKKDGEMLHRFAVYHVPAYPSVSSLNEFYSSRVRKHWVPLFDKYKLHLAFESHDHAYKRTKPLRDNKVDSSGTVYFGDGSWGTKPRKPVKASKTKYLAQTYSEQQFCYVTISNQKRTVKAIRPDGKILDEYSKNTKKSKSSK